MNCQYEVLNPWAEIDPVPLKGISPRLTDLNNKTIGLFGNDKPSTPSILKVIQEKIREKYPTVKFSSFKDDLGTLGIFEKELKVKVQEWAKGVDAAILAVGD
jgi:hypothetical protein